MSREVVVLSGVRTAIGGYGGCSERHPAERFGSQMCARSG